MMKALAAIGFASLMACVVEAGTAPSVRLLPLPRGATIDPFGPRSLMSAYRDGTVAATLTLNGYAARAIGWRPDGSYRLAPAPSSVAGFDGDGALLINASRPASLTAAWSVDPIDVSSCENFPQLSTGPVIAGALSNGSLIFTMLSPAVVDLDDASGQMAPVVLHLRSNQCLNMGNGVALGTGGAYTAGYTAYIANVPAPSNVTSSKERFVAMRWNERTREPLGAGVAIAVSAAGIAVGADGPAGRNVPYGQAVHAMLWAPNQHAVDIAPSAPLSVAYAIDGRGRVTGMLEDARGRHYAFVWERGSLRLLDDAVPARGWRFECGYAFAPDGGIVGIGTYRGTPAAFVIDLHPFG